ncbi:short-chain dehydrogenase [Actinoplanes sp. NPDC024001]|uniref:short-chain dehydrogenase n=1 Tax=Actinoplanes sp. NPDC024001 TaxID=3154598 RepID=UPI00340AC177
MHTTVIAGGTRGIGGALAERLRRDGGRVIALGSADADLSSVRQTLDLTTRLPDRVDALVLSAGRFGHRRVVTEEGLEQTFAISVLARYLLTERLRPALERSPAPVVLNLCGTGGIRGGRIHWDDLQLARRYRMFTAILQGARANDLLGAGFAARHPDSRIRYVLYNPLFVDSGMHRHLRQPARTLVGTLARLFAAAPADAAAPLADLLARPPAAPLTALRRGVPVPLTGPAFDPDAAARLYRVLAGLTAGAEAGSAGEA